MFCSNCGSALAAGAGGMPPAPVPVYMGTPGLASPMEAERQTQISRTKTGILLLLIGTLIGWLPYIGFVGSILIFVGAIFVILGRKAFGSAHSRNVILCILLVIIAIILAFTAIVVLTFSIASSFIPGNPPTQAAVTSAFNNYLIILLIGVLVSGLASVFFTYAIQDKMGRMLLLGGYAAHAIIWIALVVIVSQAIGTMVAAMFPGGTYNPGQAALALADFSGRVRVFGYLSAIPALMYAAAYYLVWNRINKGELPARSGAVPMTAPPMPPR